MSETRTLSYVVDGRWDDIPGDVQHEARRALVNYLGCALGGARDEAVDLALRALAPFAARRPRRCSAVTSASTRCTRR